MEWTESLRSAIDYIEDHLLDNISAEDIADHVHVSSFYFQKGFKIMTGYSIGEYIRCRRLYLAALDIAAGKGKMIDIAFRYGYETPESFTKAFSRFHGISPMQMKVRSGKIRTFLPLKIRILIQGGNQMDYAVEKKDKFQVIGFEREFSMDSSYREIPKFWDEFRENYLVRLLLRAEEPKNAAEQVICDCMVGKYGICIDDIGKDGRFRYLIAGDYQGGPVPDGMTVYEFPDMEWAKFRCVGPMPGALQSVNTKIFEEWLPGNPDYKIAAGYNIEWYSEGNMNATDYESSIWIPVMRK